MSPLIISNPLTKLIHDPNDFFHQQAYENVHNKTIKTEDGFENSRFHIIIYESDSSVLLQLFRDNTVVIGTICAHKTTEITNAVRGLVDGTVVQITSAFLEEQFRGEYIGRTCYEALAEIFIVLSDWQQTYSGAFFWKRSMTSSQAVIVNILEPIEDDYRLIKDATGKPLHYTPQSYPDNKIWVAETVQVLQQSNILGIKCELSDEEKYPLLLAQTPK